MTFEFNYREEVLRTCPDFFTEDMNTKMSRGGLGIAGEAGEVADLIKKFVFHDKPVDHDKIIKELGDVYWYLEYLCAVFGLTREQVMEANSKKLRARFPNGWSPAAANAKADEVRA